MANVKGNGIKVLQDVSEDYSVCGAASQIMVVCET